MKRLEALDFTRVIAMLAVVMIHVSSTFIYSDSGFTVLGMNLGFMLNQVTRFAVPLFILISGMSLGISTKGGSAVSFWKRRILKVGIPYVVWFFIYDLYNHGLDVGAYAKECLAAPRALFRGLLLGQSAPHLYFIIILIQLYLVYPLLEKALKKAPVATVALSFAVTCLIQCLYAFRRMGMDLIPKWIYPYLWLLLPTWVGYFALGAALNKESIGRIYAFAARHAWTLLCGTVFFAALYVVEAKVENSLDSIKTGLVAYVVLMVLATFALWSKIQRWEWVKKTVAFLSARSMTVYFCHVLVLYFFRRYAFFVSGMRGMLCLFAVVTLVSVWVGAMMDMAVGMVKENAVSLKK